MFYRAYKTILSPQNGMNVYRGCTHGCIYCDSRSLCYHMDHAFENIEVKENAAAQLEKELLCKRKKCMIGTGAMCDPYLPLENDLHVTRDCLSVIERLGFGLAIQTKSSLILRDLDLLTRINEHAGAIVQMTLTTYDDSLCRLVEPNVCGTKERYETLKAFQAAGIHTVVWLSPILPFLNDTEENMRGILSYCFDAGVKGILYFGAGVTMREGNREYFYHALDTHFPGLKQKYAKTFGNAYECTSPQNETLSAIFHEECEKRNVLHHIPLVFDYLHTLPPKGEQLNMFSFHPKKIVP